MSSVELPSIWSHHAKLRQKIVDEKFDNFKHLTEEMESCFSCNICQKELSNFSKMYNIGQYLQLCNDCFNIRLIQRLDLIDRRDYSVEEKPLKWNCDICAIPLGGGCRWLRNSDLDFDCCEECYNKNRILDESNYKVYNCTDLNKLYYINNDYYEPHLFEIDAKESEYTIPEQLKNEITEERNKLYIEYTSRLTNVNLKSSFLNWTLITDMPDSKHCSNVGLIVNCKDTKHPVGSIVSNNHGRTSLDLIYPTLEEYMKDSEEYAKNNDPKTFPEYIRTKRGLSFYYG
jgi:hypothetical protein